MKIGIDIRAAVEEPAGIGKIVENLVRVLASIDAENEYVLYSNRPFDVGVRNPRFRVVVTDLGAIPGGQLLWHIAVAFRSRHREKLDRFISVASLQVAALTRNFVILIIPDLTHVLFPEWHVVRPKLTGRFLLRRALRNARQIVAISQHTRNDILRYSGTEILDQKVVVAYIACEPSFSRPVMAEDLARIREKYALRAKYILSVGTIEPRKNLPTLLAAFADVAATETDIELVVAGRKGWKWQETFDAAERSRVADRIRFLEYVPPGDLPALYAGAILFVYPTFYEGFGIPPLEAMASGIPVIASNTSSLPEVVGESAVLVDPRDTQAITESIQRLLHDDRSRERLSRAGREQAGRFSWEEFARKILERVVEQS
jgi:glycosyltransferase involved in cell wall biosynthesis